MKKYIVPELVHSVYEEKNELCSSLLSTGEITQSDDFWEGTDPSDQD